MKNINKYIFEKINDTRYNTPDKIKVGAYKSIKTGEKYDVSFWWDEDDHNTCYPVVANLYNKYISIGKNKDNHSTMISTLSRQELKNLKIVDSSWELQRMISNEIEDNEEERLLFGRIFEIDEHLYDDVYLEDEFPRLIIVWWEELSSDDLRFFSKEAVKKFNNEKISDIHENYLIVDNNGNFVADNLKSNNKLKLDKRSDDYKETLKITKAIHLASQREKDIFFKEWKQKVNARKDRELQQLGWRDKDRCYAKRNNMFAKHIVRDEITGKYKTVYGAKIGDSLEQKQILDYIND